ncbi:MAG: AsmA-like C-terminal region-containing protein, partial [Verrucomicrobiota bacterium]
MVVLLIVLIVVLGLGLVYLSVMGVPTWFSDRILADARARGYEVYFRNLDFSVFDGIIAEDVLVFLDDADQHPMMEARHIILGFDPSQWFRKKVGLHTLRINKGLVRVGTEGAIRSEEDPGLVRMEEVNGVVRFEPARVRLEALEARIFGVKLACRGDVYHRPPRPEAERKKPAERSIHPGEWIDRLGEARIWLPRLVRQFNLVEFAKTPVAELDFSLHPAEPSQNQLTFRAKGRETRLRGVLFDGWTANAKVDGDDVTISEITLTRDGARIAAKGRLNLATEMVEGGVSSTLPPIYLMNLIPADLREELARSGTSFSGRLDTDLLLGPSPIKAWSKRIRGSLAVEKAEIRNVWVEKGTFTCRWDDPVFHVEHFEALAGRDDQQGRITGKLLTEPETGSFEGSVELSLDLRALLPLMSEDQKKIVRTMTFRQSPPEIKADFSGVAGDGKTFKLEGGIIADNFTFRGTFLDALRTGVRIEDQIMTLKPFRIVRSEGEVNGWLKTWFTRPRVEMDMTSSIDPTSLAMTIGPGMERTFRSFRFNGPARVKAVGIVGFKHEVDQTSYSVEVEAEDFAYDWLDIQQGTFQVKATNRVIDIHRMAGRAYDGTFTGNLRFFPDGSNARYAVSADLKTMNFGDMVKKIRQDGEQSFEGSLSGSMNYTGLTKGSAGDSIEGKAHIRIKDGDLWKIPLFGELSEILGRIMPGLGFVTQSDFTANIDIRDRAFHTRDARLKGNILSVEGKGSYHLNETLDFDVKVKPRGENPILETVRVITYPVTSLLNFKLEGTVADPKWTPENWPTDV